MKLGFWQTEKIGNNVFDYEIRKQIKGEAKIFINNLIFDNINCVELGKNIVFELVEDGQIKSFYGLKNFICDLSKKILVVDNHNYITLGWSDKNILKYLENTKFLVHLDQHSDMKDCNEDIETVEDLLLKTNVGNYLKPMTKLNLIDQVYQIRTEYKLFHSTDFLENKKFLLNIDLDFWHKEMNISEKTVEIVSNLIKKSVFTFIAFSPYFIDFEDAKKIFIKLFE